MSSKSDILQNIDRHIKTVYEMPHWDIKPMQYEDKVAQFVQILKTVGGNAMVLEEGKDVNQLIKELYPEARRIASNLEAISIASESPDTIDNPKELNGVDLSIVKGEYGVAENGSVWVPLNVKNRIIYFISEYLVILLDKNKLLDTMHEAYDKIEIKGKDFGVFISGPSKTADIEQALVVGAQGAKGLTVIFV